MRVAIRFADGLFTAPNAPCSSSPTLTLLVECHGKHTWSRVAIVQPSADGTYSTRIDAPVAADATRRAVISFAVYAPHRPHEGGAGPIGGAVLDVLDCTSTFSAPIMSGLAQAAIGHVDVTCRAAAAAAADANALPRTATHVPSDEYTRALATVSGEIARRHASTPQGSFSTADAHKLREHARFMVYATTTALSGARVLVASYFNVRFVATMPATLIEEACRNSLAMYCLPEHDFLALDIDQLAYDAARDDAPLRSAIARIVPSVATRRTAAAAAAAAPLDDRIATFNMCVSVAAATAAFFAQGHVYTSDILAHRGATGFEWRGSDVLGAYARSIASGDCATKSFDFAALALQICLGKWPATAPLVRRIAALLASFLVVQTITTTTGAANANGFSDATSYVQHVLPFLVPLHVGARMLDNEYARSAYPLDMVTDMNDMAYLRSRALLRRTLIVETTQDANVHPALAERDAENDARDSNTRHALSRVPTAGKVINLTATRQFTNVQGQSADLAYVQVRDAFILNFSSPATNAAPSGRVLQWMFCTKQARDNAVCSGASVANILQCSTSLQLVPLHKPISASTFATLADEAALHVGSYGPLLEPSAIRLCKKQHTAPRAPVSLSPLERALFCVVTAAYTAPNSIAVHVPRGNRMPLVVAAFPGVRVVDTLPRPANWSESVYAHMLAGTDAACETLFAAFTSLFETRDGAALPVALRFELLGGDNVRIRLLQWMPTFPSLIPQG